MRNFVTNQTLCFVSRRHLSPEMRFSRRHAAIARGGVQLSPFVGPFLGSRLGSEVGRAKVHPHRALQFGAPHFCEKCGTRRGPAKVSRWTDHYGPAGMVITDFVDDYVQDYAGLLYVCAEVLLRACPIHLSLNSAKLNPAQFMSRTMMYHDIPSWWISLHKGFPFIRDFPV